MVYELRSRWPALSLPALGIVTGFLVVLFFQLALLYPLHARMDLPLWDESNYMGGGARWIAGEGTLGGLSGSPLYALLYGLFTPLFGRVNSIFAMLYFLGTGVSVLLFFFLAQQLRSAAIATLLTVLWAVSSYNVSGIPQITGAPFVYRFGLLLFLLALLFVPRNRWIALLLLLMCVFTRLEYLFLFVPYALYVLVITLRRNRSRGDAAGRGTRKITAPAAVAVGALSLFALFVAANIPNWELGGNRSWFAFQQHYAVGEVLAGQFDGDPWIEYNLVIERDFPGSHSLRDALAQNPTAFFTHLTRNLRRMPGSLLSFVRPDDVVAGPFMYAALASFAAVTVLLFMLSTPKVLVGEFKRALLRQGDLLILTLFLPLSLLPSFIATTGSQYLLSAMPFVFLYLGIAYVTVEQVFLTSGRATFESSVLYRMVRWLPLAVAAVTIVVALRGPSPFEYWNLNRTVYNNVTSMKAIWPEGQVRVLGLSSSSYQNYMSEERFIGIEPFATVSGGEASGGDTGPAALVALHQPDALLLSTEESASLDTASFGRWIDYTLDNAVIYFNTDTARPAPPQELPPGVTTSPDLRVSLGAGWHSFEPTLNIRWMRSPGHLWVYAGEETDATMSFVPFGMNVNGAFGVQGELRVALNDTVQVVPVSAGQASETQLHLQPGFNLIQMELAAGNFTPGTGDDRLLSIAFSQINVRSLD